MTLRMPFLCASCARYNNTNDTCEAFPYGIPGAILNGAPHWEPWPGDHDLQYQASEAKGDILQSYLLFWFSVEESG